MNTRRLSDRFSRKHVIGEPQVAVAEVGLALFRQRLGDAGDVALVVAGQLGDGAKGAGDALLALLAVLGDVPLAGEGIGHL